MKYTTSCNLTAAICRNWHDWCTQY